MIHILQKIADWVIDHEKNAATDCTVPNEIIDDWLKTIEERKKHMAEHGNTDCEQYQMLEALDRKVKEIEAIRQQKCEIPQKS